MSNKSITSLKKGTVPLCLFFVFQITPQFTYSQPINLSLSVLNQYFYFQEFSQEGTVLDTESGWLQGLKLDTSFALHNTGILSADVSFLNGRVDYDGLTQSLNKHHTKTDELILESNLMYIQPDVYSGYSIGVLIGATRWERDIQPANNVLGLHEVYSWNNLGLVQTIETSNIEIRLALQYLLNGDLEVDLTEVNKGKVNVPLPTGRAADLTASYRLAASEQLSFFCELTSRWRYFPRSQLKSIPGGAINEPENELFQAGLNFKVSYLFN